ncbi:MAG TPA: response regulator transcription factor [Solirubrobacterales bacterium]|nr:response regulator transcription factor [Solirubrobacterales bacterium]
MEARGSNPSLVIVDAHQALCAGLSLLLERHGFDVLACAGSAEEGEEEIARRQPLAALVSLSLPDESGAGLVRRLTARGAPTKFLVYTDLTDPTSLAGAFRCGADGFVAKAGGVSVLVEALRAVAAGGRFRDPAFARAAQGNGSPSRVLSRREAQILEMLSTGLTGEEIARHLVLSPETIRTHVRNAMAKLKARTRTEAVVKALTRAEIRPELLRSA